jgi:L-fucose isomerase-like protein
VTLRGRAFPATVARLCRVNGKYWMHLGQGNSVDITDAMMYNRKWGREYPTVAVDLGISTREFARVAASNHYCLIPGDATAEIKYACALLGVPVLRIDSPQGVEDVVEKMTVGDVRE